MGQTFRRAGVGRVGRISQFQHRTLTALYFSLMKSINIDLRGGGASIFLRGQGVWFLLTKMAMLQLHVVIKQTQKQNSNIMV